MRAVVPEPLYSGPEHNKEKHLYTGVKVHAENTTWMITEDVVLLFPSESDLLLPGREAVSIVTILKKRKESQYAFRSSASRSGS